MQLRALVFSDLHLKNYTRFSEWNEQGLTGRAVDCLSIIDQVFKTAKDRGINTVLFAGDLFHDRSKIDVSLFNATYKKFLEYEDSGIDVFCVAGNHDQVSKSENENSIQLFDNIRNVYILNCEVFERGSFDIVGIPAIEDKDVLFDVAMRTELNNPAILLTHSQITNSVTSNGIKMLNGLPVKELSGRYVGVVCGDIHQFQIINENVIIPGSSLQHHFGDKDSDKFILDVVFDKDGVVSVEKINTKKPEFFTVSLEEVKSKKDGFNFFLVSCNKVLSNDEIESIRDSVKNVDFVYDIQYEVADDTIDIKKIGSHRDLLRSYVETIDCNFTSDELFEFAENFLECE